jgi:DNA-binding transcriptional regulator YdaS (Cro superfamily)
MDLKTYTEPAGAAAKLAKALGIAPALISQWTTEKEPRQVPAPRCVAIEAETAGAVTCEEMRPDVLWVRVKDRKWPHPKGRPLIDLSQQPEPATVAA